MQRVLKWIGESGFWRLVGKIHVRFYRWTGGLLGKRAGKLDHLLLTTTGRKSGALRTVPLTYMPDGNRFILVASNGGADRHPAWWLNLEHTPRATVEVGRERVGVTAIRADEHEHARLWPMLKTYNPFYGQYEQITERSIPVVILQPDR